MGEEGRRRNQAPQLGWDGPGLAGVAGETTGAKRRRYFEAPAGLQSSRSELKCTINQRRPGCRHLKGLAKPLPTLLHLSPQPRAMSQSPEGRACPSFVSPRRFMCRCATCVGEGSPRNPRPIPLALLLVFDGGILAGDNCLAWPVSNPLPSSISCHVKPALSLPTRGANQRTWCAIGRRPSLPNLPHRYLKISTMPPIPNANSTRRSIG